MKNIFILIMFLFPAAFFGSVLLKIPVGKSEISLEMLGLAYMPLDWTIPLTGKRVPKIHPQRERDIYRHLLTHLPRFLVFELSAYPLPLVGVAIRSYAPDFYRSMTLWTNFNLIESVTVSFFEEPWAASVFIGNVVDFAPFDTTNRASFWNPGEKGRGFSGILISYGRGHIKHNIIILEDWLETEIKLIGNFSSHQTEISWSYRFGLRKHFHRNIDSYLYLGLKRDRLDRGLKGFSPIKNSLLDFEIDYDIDKAVFHKVSLIIGKKFPIKKKKWIPELNLGFIWKFNSLYTGNLNEPGDTGFAFIFAPNIRF